MWCWRERSDKPQMGSQIPGDSQGVGARERQGSGMGTRNPHRGEKKVLGITVTGGQVYSDEQGKKKQETDALELAVLVSPLRAPKRSALAHACLNRIIVHRACLLGERRALDDLRREAGTRSFNTVTSDLVKRSREVWRPCWCTSRISMEQTLQVFTNTQFSFPSQYRGGVGGRSQLLGLGSGCVTAWPWEEGSQTCRDLALRWEDLMPSFEGAEASRPCIKPSLESSVGNLLAAGGPHASRDLNKGFFIFTFPATSEMAGSMVGGGLTALAGLPTATDKGKPFWAGWEEVIQRCRSPSSASSTTPRFPLRKPAAICSQEALTKTGGHDLDVLCNT
ncbi:hypothetical protein Cadr_000006134 [Camelus dromedarius]|uniref:Uncharacterized protein n=1 Tax=Camelus dromedarius TaxID=9838 RepID=A0A5N4E2U9_CAMDR|nr:hypothetical protein Cadr_000006134 [Camelus dromedarius]